MPIDRGSLTSVYFLSILTMAQKTKKQPRPGVAQFKVDSKTGRLVVAQPIATDVQQMMDYLAKLHSPGMLQIIFQELLLGLPPDLPVHQRELRLTALRTMGYKDYNKHTSNDDFTT